MVVLTQDRRPGVVEKMLRILRSDNDCRQVANEAPTSRTFTCRGTTICDRDDQSRICGIMSCYRSIPESTAGQGSGLGCSPTPSPTGTHMTVELSHHKFVRNQPVSTHLPRPFTDIWKWQLDASCRGMDSSIFFHPDNERGFARIQRVERAKEICHRCPVLTQCRTHALEVDEPYGIWGGLSEIERLATKG